MTSDESKMSDLVNRQLSKRSVDAKNSVRALLLTDSLLLIDSVQRVLLMIIGSVGSHPFLPIGNYAAESTSFSAVLFRKKPFGYMFVKRLNITMNK